jgi:hypothetical protein
MYGCLQPWKMVRQPSRYLVPGFQEPQESSKMEPSRGCRPYIANLESRAPSPRAFSLNLSLLALSSTTLCAAKYRGGVLICCGLFLLDPSCMLSYVTSRSNHTLRPLPKITSAESLLPRSALLQSKMLVAVLEEASWTGAAGKYHLCRMVYWTWQACSEDMALQAC